MVKDKDKVFLADNRVGESVFVWAKDWEEAERKCKEDGDTLVGLYLGTVRVSGAELRNIASEYGIELDDEDDEYHYSSQEGDWDDEQDD
jgi:hypothetical protein